MEFKKLPVSKLTMNTGQIEGVPANPRQWTQADLDRLAASIEETPELLDARGAIVVPHKGKFVVLGGNMRLTAAKKLGLAEMPCAVLPADTPAEKMKEIVVKDNGAFGAWDFDALANEWDDLPLTDWGVPAWKTEEETELIDTSEEEDNYSRKIEVPIYEPTGEDVQLNECRDKTKYDELIAEIDKDATLTSEERTFLKDAAARHIVFNYARIADYYANARPSVQRLMEKSALVIIDFDKAMENGFITMAHKIADIYSNDYDEE